METLNNNKNFNEEQRKEEVLEQPTEQKIQGEAIASEGVVDVPQKEQTPQTELTQEQLIARVLAESQNDSKIKLKQSKLTIGKEQPKVKIDESEVNKKTISELNCQVLKYKKVDSILGYLTDANQINELKRLQQIDVLQNALLGDYDEAGQYVISDEIKAECVKARKVITSQYQNYVYVETFREIQGFSKLKFHVTVNKLGEDALVAKLTLLENVKRVNGYVINVETCEIAEYKGARCEEFYYEMKRAFNIIKDDYKDISEQDEIENFKYVIQRKSYRKILWENSLKQIEKTEKKLYEDRMELLKHMGNDPNALELIRNFRQSQLKVSNTFMNDRGNYWLTNNLLFTTCLENMPKEFKNIFDLAMRESFPQDLTNLQNNIFEGQKDLAQQRAMHGKGVDTRVITPNKEIEKEMSNTPNATITSFSTLDKAKGSQPQAGKDKDGKQAPENKENIFKDLGVDVKNNNVLATGEMGEGGLDSEASIKNSEAIITDSHQNEDEIKPKNNGGRGIKTDDFEFER